MKVCTTLKSREDSGIRHGKQYVVEAVDIESMQVKIRSNDESDAHTVFMNDECHAVINALIRNDLTEAMHGNGGMIDSVTTDMWKEMDSTIEVTAVGDDEDTKVKRFDTTSDSYRTHFHEILL